MKVEGEDETIGNRQEAIGNDGVESQKLKVKSGTKPEKNETENPNTPLTIGWTGSHSTLMYLDPVIPVFQELQEEFDFEFVVIANRDPKLKLKNYRFIKWTEENEVTDLQQMDIGIMPLEDTEWAKGKCGFKLIQYGAVGIPSVASPVGVNSQVLVDNKTGFLASTADEWKTSLSKLLNDKALREKMGRQAREHIVANYSVESQKEKFLSLFEKS
jgi:glycosyltransferase involved in cell wall biosynthesis